MRNTFLIADCHFGHRAMAMATALNPDGSKLRPWNTTEEMDEALVANWNSVVGPKDKVYVLGDVVINRKALPTIGRLKGDKILIKGNHDVFRIDEYLEYFTDVRAYAVKTGMIMSHIPVHRSQIDRFGANVHGHLHNERIMHTDFGFAIDEDYLCVSVEQINYTPISLDEVRLKLKEQQ